MKRYIKVKGQWIDTLLEQKNGYIYFIIKSYVSYYSDETGCEYEIGILEDESDVL